MPAPLLTSAENAAAMLRDGALVAFPTDTVYGIAALADADFDNQKLRAFKGGRSERFSLHAGSAADAMRFGGPLTTAEQRMVARWCPAGVTLVVAHPRVRTLGLRVVTDSVGACFLKAAQVPVVATSANLHGQPTLTDPQGIAALPGVDAVLDGGISTPRPASTVARMLPTGFEVLRQGSTKLMPLTTTFVCLGNLNRSAFAHRWLQVASEWWGARVSAFTPYYAPSSMGLIARSESRAPALMQEAAQAYGVDLSEHVPTRLAPDLLSATELAVAMDDDVAGAVTAAATGEVLNLRVNDPMARGGPAFGLCARKVLDALAFQLLARTAAFGPADAQLESEFRKVMWVPETP